MEICSSGHDEICFEGRSSDCPLCKMIEEKDAIINGLREEIEEWEKSQ